MCHKNISPVNRWISALLIVLLLSGCGLLHDDVTIKIVDLEQLPQLEQVDRLELTIKTRKGIVSTEIEFRSGQKLPQVDSGIEWVEATAFKNNQELLRGFTDAPDLADPQRFTVKMLRLGAFTVAYQDSRLQRFSCDSVALEQNRIVIGGGFQDRKQKRFVTDTLLYDTDSNQLQSVEPASTTSATDLDRGLFRLAGDAVVRVGLQTTETGLFDFRLLPILGDSGLTRVDRPACWRDRRGEEVCLKVEDDIQVANWNVANAFLVSRAAVADERGVATADTALLAYDLSTQQMIPIDLRGADSDELIEASTIVPIDASSFTLVGGRRWGSAAAADSVQLYRRAKGSDWVFEREEIPLVAARQGQIPLVLPDHRTILIAGGDQPTNAAVELVDLSGVRSRYSGAAQTSRIDHRVVARPDGSVWLLGGVDPVTKQPLTDIDRVDLLSEQIDRANDHFDQPLTLNRKRADGSAIALADGRLVLIGGSSGIEAADDEVDSIELYLPPDWHHPTVLREKAGDYRISGNIDGLVGSVTVALQVDGDVRQEQQITAQGPFAVETRLTNGMHYELLITAQPSGMGCRIVNGAGVVASRDIYDVVVSCHRDLQLALKGQASQRLNSRLHAEIAETDPSLWFLRGLATSIRISHNAAGDLLLGWLGSDPEDQNRLHWFVSRRVGKNWIHPTTHTDHLTKSGVAISSHLFSPFEMERSEFQLFLNDDGDGLAVWTQHPENSGCQSSYLAELHAGEWSYPFSSDGRFTIGCLAIPSVKVAIAKNGEVVLAWFEVGEDSRHHLFVSERRFDSRQQAFVWTKPSGSDDHLSRSWVGHTGVNRLDDLALLDNGDTVLIWEQRSTSPRGNMMLKADYRFNPDTNARGWKSQNYPVDPHDYFAKSDKSDFISPAKVFARENGELLVIWEQLDSGARCGVDPCRRIGFREFKQNSWGSIQAIGFAEAHAILINVATNSRGETVIVWQSKDSTTDCTNGQGAAAPCDQLYLTETRSGIWIDALQTKPLSFTGKGFVAGPPAGLKSLTMNDLGDTLLAWAQYDDSTECGFRGCLQLYQAQFVDSRWVRPAGRQDHLNPTALVGDEPILATYPAAGHAVVVWLGEDGTTDCNNRSCKKIFTATYNGGGWDVPLTVDDAVGFPGCSIDRLALTEAGEEDVFLLWRGDKSKSDLGVRCDNLYLSEFRENRWQHPKNITDRISPIGDPIEEADLVSPRAGDALIAWETITETASCPNCTQLFVRESRLGQPPD